MNPAILGTFAALSWGGGDFIARFTGRALGQSSALFGMLLVGSVAQTIYVLVTGLPIGGDWGGLWLLILSGASVTLGTWTLYLGFIRGPITIVSPIVASYPALVVAAAVVLGARPSLLQWAAMAWVMVGVLMVARATRQLENMADYTRPALRRTVLIAVFSSICFALAVSAGQHAVPFFGEVQTTWLTRLISLVVLLPVFFLPGERLFLPVRWWPALIAQGCMDTGAYLAVFAGAAGPGGEIAAVVAAGFGAVTVLLARFILKEPMTAMQWMGLALIVSGSAVLAG